VDAGNEAKSKNSVFTLRGLPCPEKMALTLTNAVSEGAQVSPSKDGEYFIIMSSKAQVYTFEKTTIPEPTK
jgi:hypothetical protein